MMIRIYVTRALLRCHFFVIYMFTCSCVWIYVRGKGWPPETKLTTRRGAFCLFLFLHRFRSLPSFFLLFDIKNIAITAKLPLVALVNYDAVCRGWLAQVGDRRWRLQTGDHLVPRLKALVSHPSSSTTSS
jgi:hypothetical protein